MLATMIDFYCRMLEVAAVLQSSTIFMIIFRKKKLVYSSFLACLIYVILYQKVLVQKESSPRYKWRTSPLSDTNLSCPYLFAGDTTEITKADSFVFDEASYIMRILDADDRCKFIKDTFSFYSESLSEEEAEYPLAYGMLVHKNPIQIYFLLSALYQPQNQFCIAVDGKTDAIFYGLMKILPKCFPNVHVFKTSNIAWGDYSILTSVFSCVQYLSNLTEPWEYYQYLTGVDIPLKTNLEMVKIFKQLNGSFHAELLSFPRSRIRKKKTNPPLPLYKTSLSVMFSRRSAEFMVKNEKVLELIEWLKDTDIADESLWATIAGNPNDLIMPGGFDAAEYMARIQNKRKGLNKTELYEALKIQAMGSNINNVPSHFYIARYQQWYRELCGGKIYKFSCVFGVRDLPVLMKRYELLAHKFYMDFQPAAYFCLLEEVRRRAIQDSLAGQSSFYADAYGHLPEAPMRVS